MNNEFFNLLEIAPLIKQSESAILLDSAKSDPRNNKTYLFLGTNTIVGHHFNEISQRLEQLEIAVQDKWFAGFFSYEMGFALEPSLQKLQKKDGFRQPLLWGIVTPEPYIFDHQTGQWNRPLPTVTNTIPHEAKDNTVTLQKKITQEAYIEALQKIKHHIREGDTYQVNFTFDIDVSSDLSPFDLYCHLRENQKTPCCSFIKNPYGQVISFSPELFFRIDNEKIMVKPMKGTAKRGSSAEEDEKIVQFLQNDNKNNAENLMIVDLLRNDLGSVCEAGSVQTTKLFEVETHKTVHQMTSTVEGKLQPQTSIKTLLYKLFPCGSVTGAPKIRTLEIIDSLESGRRGVYCGAIGFVSPQMKQACFSVPIRTMQKKYEDTRWQYRVGSGVIWDSIPEEEWEECDHKCTFLTVKNSTFQLIETLALTKGVYYLEELHINRIERSAHYFNYPFNRDELVALLEQIKSHLNINESWRIRVTLKGNGNFDYQISSLQSNTDTIHTVTWAKNPVDSKNIYLYHKTTNRSWYEESSKLIEEGRAFDCIYVNERDDVTEGGRSNIFVEKNGCLYTPPINVGLLGGTLREHLITTGQCKEKILYRQDLLEAEKIYCGNSVRGLVAVTFTG